jgi:hypothetical protein
MAHALLERETLDREEIQLVLKGQELPPVRKRLAAKPDHPPVAENPTEVRTPFPGKPQPLPRPNTP